MKKRCFFTAEAQRSRRDGRDGARPYRAVEGLGTKLRNDFDGNAGTDGVDELGGVPVGEAEATVGASPGDIFRFGCAMDAVALQGKTDPGGADGVIGSRGKNQFVGDAFLLGNEGEDFRVEGVVGVGGDVGLVS